MQITRENNALPWTDTDINLWSAFLQTTAGMRLIPRLCESAPGLLDGADVNKTLVRNGELRGFQQAVSALLALQYPEPTVVDNQTGGHYPSPENDAAWQDGKKLITEPN